MIAGLDAGDVVVGVDVTESERIGDQHQRYMWGGRWRWQASNTQMFQTKSDEDAVVRP